MSLKSIAEKFPKRMAKFFPQLLDDAVYKQDDTSITLRCGIIACVGTVNQVLCFLNTSGKHVHDMYNPLEPHSYIVKLGYAGVRVPTIYVLRKNKENIKFFPMKFSYLLLKKKVFLVRPF